MATKILTDYAFAAPGTQYSAIINNISNIEIAAIVTGANAKQIKYTIQRKTQNTDWRTVNDQNGSPIEFYTIGPNSSGVNIIGVNAAYLRVKAEILGGTGTLNIEYEIV